MREMKSSSWTHANRCAPGLGQTHPLRRQQSAGRGGCRGSGHQVRGESSSLSLEKSIVVDLRQTSYLEWEWKVTVLPKRGNVTASLTDDQAGQVLVTFPKTLFERRKVIAYLRDFTAAKGTMAAAPGPLFLNIRGIVVESGDNQHSKWVLEKRNLLEDFRALFGSTPERAIGPDPTEQSTHRLRGRRAMEDNTIHFSVRRYP